MTLPYPPDLSLPGGKMYPSKKGIVPYYGVTVGGWHVYLFVLHPGSGSLDIGPMNMWFVWAPAMPIEKAFVDDDARLRAYRITNIDSAVQALSLFYYYTQNPTEIITLKKGRL
ncbi:hypothetical protein [Pseudolabrys sp.]|uniref:hypothetical protein n=1 Tax=Pseudolabrys sp. TaxID=1960880 RepID=UPI003D119D48